MFDESGLVGGVGGGGGVWVGVVVVDVRCGE